MRRLARAALLLAMTTAPCARANSIASVVVTPGGRITFTDYARDRIWGLDESGALTVRATQRHTHHLVLDGAGRVYGEHRTRRGDSITIWTLRDDGSVEDVFEAARRGQTSSYRGTVFTLDPEGRLLYLQDCQIVRLTAEGGLAPVAGRRCAGRAWDEEALRYGHLHGSLAWGPAGELYFSDARTIRRVSASGEVTTLAGRPTTLFADPQPGERRFDRVMGLGVDARGRLWAADGGRREIVRLDERGAATTMVRLGAFWSPIGLAVSGEDVYFLVNVRIPTPGFLGGIFGNPTLRKLSADGRVRTVASVKGRPATEPPLE